MKIIRLTTKALALLALTFAATAAAHAQIGNPTVSRTYVATYGDDAGPCSRTRPCRNFDAALAAVAAGGEVLALDDGIYAKTTVSKEATIAAPAGVHAEIAPASGSAVTINVGDGKTVVVRNLYLSSRGGANGLLFSGGQFSTLHVENCVVAGFAGKGIGFGSAQGGRLFVKDTTVRDGGTGIEVAGSAVNVRASIDRSRVENSKYAGVAALGYALVAVRDTTAAGTDIGFSAQGATATMTLERCQATHNKVGVSSQDTAIVGVSNSTFVYNGADLQSSTGHILSYGGNTVSDNYQFVLTVPKK